MVARVIAIIVPKFSAFQPMLGKINKERELTNKNSEKNAEFGKTGNQIKLTFWHPLSMLLSSVSVQVPPLTLHPSSRFFSLLPSTLTPSQSSFIHTNRS